MLMIKVPLQFIRDTNDGFMIIVKLMHLKKKLNLEYTSPIIIQLVSTLEITWEIASYSPRDQLLQLLFYVLYKTNT